MVSGTPGSAATPLPSSFAGMTRGAGPAGASCAILLARAGWSVALIERRCFPRRKVCGECIAASNLPLLQALGIGEDFLTLAGPELHQVALMRANSTVIADLPPADHPTLQWGRALGRETLDTLLIDQARACGAHILQPWSAQAIEGRPGDWQCDVRSRDSSARRTLTAGVAIAANGSWEGLPAEGLRRKRPLLAGDLLAFKATFHDASLAKGLLPILSFDGGYGGMVDGDGGMTTLTCCIRRDRLLAARDAARGQRAGAVVEALLLRECGGVRLALRSARRIGPWLAAGPLAPGIRLGCGDTPFRVGNAAGEAHPIIGEGISMALQSAWLLCSTLLEVGRSPLPPDGFPDGTAQRLLAVSYRSKWRHHFEPRLRLAAAFAHLAMRPAGAVPLVALASAWPGLLTLGARWSGKTACALNDDAIGAMVVRTAIAARIPPMTAARHRTFEPEDIS